MEAFFLTLFYGAHKIIGVLHVFPSTPIGWVLENLN